MRGHKHTNLSAFCRGKNIRDSVHKLADLGDLCDFRQGGHHRLCRWCGPLFTGTYKKHMHIQQMSVPGASKRSTTNVPIGTKHPNIQTPTRESMARLLRKVVEECIRFANLSSSVARVKKTRH